MTLEEKLVAVLSSYLKGSSEDIDSLGEIYNPFDESVVTLPALFIRPQMDEESITNTGIFSIDVDIELRYLVSRESSDPIMTIWRAVHTAIFGVSFPELSDLLTAVDPDNFLVHFIELAETQPTSRDGERHQRISLRIGCAKP